MDAPSQTCKCPFRHTLVTRDYGCEHAQEVTFREGPGIACTSPESWERCRTLFEALKAASLPAFEVADDLTEMPASVIGKIQYGGLAALAGLMPEAEKPLTNINALVEAVMDKYGAIEQLDYDAIVPIIKDYRMRKRRKG